MKDKYVLTQYAISSGLSNRLTVGLVSDLHEHDPENVLMLLRQGKPDLIMVTGDLFERHGEGRDTGRMPGEGRGSIFLRSVLMRLDDLFERMLGKREHDPENARRFLLEAGKLAPVFISRGNHEWYYLPEDVKAMRESGACFLDNEDCVIRIKGESIRIGGLSPQGDMDWLNAFCKKDGYKILLCHHPEYYKLCLRERKIDLILSGHAHGGQVRIGHRGLYAPGQGLFPQYTKGIYDGKLVVTTGCTNTASVPRWGNPCEAVMIHL